MGPTTYLETHVADIYYYVVDIFSTFYASLHSKSSVESMLTSARSMWQGCPNLNKTVTSSDAIAPGTSKAVVLKKKPGESQDSTT